MPAGYIHAATYILCIDQSGFDLGTTLLQTTAGCPTVQVTEFRAVAGKSKVQFSLVAIFKVYTSDH